MGASQRTGCLFLIRQRQLETERAAVKISAGSAHIGGPLCLYDDNGDAIALMSDKRQQKELTALALVAAFNRQWQPIETAPQDETRVLACCMYANDSEAYGWHPITVYFSCGEWREQSDGEYAGALTHWMPLPEPPKLSK